MNLKISLHRRACGMALLLGGVTANGLCAVPGRQDAAVLMISIDGLHPSYVLDADRRGVRLPILGRLVEQGAYATQVLNVNPTVTYPNHTSLVTGALPQQHGIYTNTVFDPTGQEQGAWNWYGAQITAPTLWDLAKAQGMTTASVLWPVSVGQASIDYNVPEYWRNKRPYDHYLMEAVSSPRGFLQSVNQATGEHYHASGDGLALDEKSTNVAIAMIERGKPQLLTVHLVALDGAQHEHGPLNQDSIPVLEKVDAMVGRIIDATRKAHPQATIAIVSDHGFLPVTTQLNLNAALSAAGLIELSTDSVPKVTSWKAYAWNSGGSSSVVLKDPNDTETRAKVQQILATLAADSANGIDSVLSGAEALSAGGLPQAAFVVDCRSGFAMGQGLKGDVLTSNGKTTGTHGYLNHHPEMSSAFFVIGPGISAGKNLGKIDIRSIAPTLANELHLQIPGATQPMLPIRD